MHDLLEFNDSARMRDDVTLMAVRYEGYAIERTSPAEFEADMCS